MTMPPILSLAVVSTLLLQLVQPMPCSRDGPRRHMFIGPKIPVDNRLRLDQIHDLEAYTARMHTITNRGMQPMELCSQCQLDDQILSWKNTDFCFKPSQRFQGKGFIRCAGGLGYEYPCPKGLFWAHQHFICTNDVGDEDTVWVPAEGATEQR